MYRIKQLQKWLEHRSDKTGGRGAAYFAATWHIPLRVLHQYSSAKVTSQNAQFPWSMSKEDGVHYACDESLRIKRADTMGNDARHHYYVAPIITDDKFRQDVLQHYTTPAKNQGGGSVSTRSHPSQSTSPGADGTPLSSLTPSVASPVPSQQEALVSSIIGTIASSELLTQTADNLVKNVQALSTLLHSAKKETQDAKERADMFSNMSARSEAALEDSKVRMSCGLSGLLLTSAQWHKDNPDACKKYFQFPTFDELKAYLGAFWPADFGDTVAEAKRFASSLPKQKLTKFERCLITMMRLNGSGERLYDLKIVWGRSERAISKAIKSWLPKFGKIGNMLSILDIPEHYLTKACPQPFKDAKMVKIAGLVDGKVIMTAESRQESTLKKNMYSDKVGHGGMSVLQYGAPNGLIFAHNPVMLGRASETMMVKYMGLFSTPLRQAFKSEDGEVITKEWPRNLGKIHKGWFMLVDRGFAKHAVYYPHKNFHLYPSFAGKRKQFTKTERGKDKTLCRLRWVNEANFDRMLYTRCLKDIVGWPFIPLIPAAVAWGFGMSNLQQPFHRESAPPQGREGDGDASSGDEDNDIEDDSDDHMASVGGGNDSESDESEEDNGSEQTPKRQLSPDRRAGPRGERASPAHQRQRR